MNTHYTTYKLLLSAVFLLLGMQTMLAQDAFYIYRNDGDFDGFFYDQVKRIGYSKTDLEGNEHDVFVVQEVETLDSLYRIPLAAIDSVGFVQPEIIFNPRLRNMADVKADGKRMSDYVKKVEANSSVTNLHTLYFDENMPEGLVPKEGDVLVDFYNPFFKPEDMADEDYSGFSGKVQYVWKGGGYYEVGTGPLESLSDIFTQFISAEVVSEDEDGNQARRLAGWNARRSLDDIVNVQGSANATILDADATLKHDFAVGDGAVGVELNVKLKAKLAAVYKITLNDLFIKTLTIEETELRAGLSAKYSGDFEGQLLGLPKRASSIKFPANAPILQTRPIPYAFVRVSGEMGAKLELPAVRFYAKQNCVIDGDKFPMMSFSNEIHGPNETMEKGILESTDLSLYMSGSAQIGVKLSANIESNDWIEDIFQTGISLDLYVGPQVEGKVELKENLKNLLDGTTNLYQMLKGSNINVSGLAANLEASGIMKFLGDEDKQTFLQYSKKYMEATWNLFPDLDRSEAYYDKEKGVITSFVRATKPVFAPTKLGMGVFTVDNELLNSQFNAASYFLNENAFNEGKFDFSGLSCGNYLVRPVLRVLGLDVPADPTFNIVVTPILVQGKDSTKETFKLEADVEKIEIPFKTNAEKVEVFILDAAKKRTTPAEGFYEVSEAATGLHDRTLTLYPGKNSSPIPQECEVLLSASVTKNGESFEATDTVGIIQSVNARDFINVRFDIYNSNAKQNYHYWGHEISGEEFDYTNESVFNNDLVLVNAVKCVRIGDVIQCSAFNVLEDIDDTRESGDHRPEAGIDFSATYVDKVKDTNELTFTIDISSLENLTVNNVEYKRNREEYHSVDYKGYEWNTRNGEMRQDMKYHSAETSSNNVVMSFQGPAIFKKDDGHRLYFEVFPAKDYSMLKEKKMDNGSNAYDYNEYWYQNGTTESHMVDTFTASGTDETRISIIIYYNPD